MKRYLQLALMLAGLAPAAQATAQVTDYEREEYRGRSVTAARDVEDLRHEGFSEGAAIGRNSGRGDASQRIVTTQDVQRCSRNPNQAHPACWDVTYHFRRQEYRVRMTHAPGRTITVNEAGEPRV
jgi:uncharacterized protein YcfJ